MSAVPIVRTLCDNGLVRRWDEKKNRAIKARHGAGIDEILAGGHWTGIVEVNAKYPSQRRLVFWFEGYAWILVYEPDRDRYANAWPSRKYQRRLKNEDEE